MPTIIELTIKEDGTMTVGTETAAQESAEQPEQGGNETPVNSLEEALAAVKHLATQAIAMAGQQQTDQTAQPAQLAGPSDDEQQETSMQAAYNGPGSKGAM
jgi:hypothetical protein